MSAPWIVKIRVILLATPDKNRSRWYSYRIYIVTKKHRWEIEFRGLGITYPRIRINVIWRWPIKLYTPVLLLRKCATSKKPYRQTLRYHTFSFTWTSRYKLSVGLTFMNSLYLGLSEQQALGTLTTKAEGRICLRRVQCKIYQNIRGGPRNQINQRIVKNCNAADGDQYQYHDCTVGKLRPNNGSYLIWHGNVQEWTSTCPTTFQHKASRTLARTSDCDLAVVKEVLGCRDKVLGISRGWLLKKTVRSPLPRM